MLANLRKDFSTHSDDGLLVRRAALEAWVSQDLEELSFQERLALLILL